MKKITKTLVALGCVATLSAGVCAMVACGGDKGKTGEAYGLTHGTNRFIGYATVTVKGDKVTDATLTEVSLPTQVKFGENKDQFYAKVTYGTVTMTYDTEAATYKIGNQTITQFFQTEANCKAYYEASIGNKITAYETAEGTANTTAMTKATLSKEENGYWTVSPKEGETFTAYSQWKFNRDATLKYVKDHGVESLLTLAKPETPVNVTLPNGAEKPAWVDGNGVSTGATWNDLGSKPEANTYVSYAQLIKNAYDAIK